MALPALYGHDRLRGWLETAIASGRFPQATLFTGPQGVGKQRLALWVAQGLLCDRGPGTPCGSCTACHQVERLGHPDLHWFVPLAGLRATDPEKQVEEVRGALAQAVAERRDSPLYGPPDGMARHALAAIRLLQRILVLRPFQGDRRVVIVGQAERLVVQDASQEAANALLKALEEPPRGTFLILTAREPQALLPTIRSRLVPVRVASVGDDAVRRFLSRELKPKLAGAALEQRVVWAEGSIGRALAGARVSESGARAAESLIESVRRGRTGWVPLALAQPPWSARGDFTAMLDALSVRLRDQLAATSSAKVAGQERVVEAIWRVEETRALAQGNVNPQLALASLAVELEELLAS